MAAATCKRGHPRTAETTYTDAQGDLRCRPCARQVKADQRASSQKRPPRIREKRAAADLSWAVDAACRGEDINLFFGPDGEHQTAKEAREDKAREICHVCPIRRECAEYALTAPERDGFWGGLNEDERTSERRRRTRRANAA